MFLPITLPKVYFIIWPKCLMVNKPEPKKKYTPITITNIRNGALQTVSFTQLITAANISGNDIFIIPPLKIASLYPASPLAKYSLAVVVSVEPFHARYNF